jgi:DNA-binding CsgD family transcriptional regulator
MGPIPGKPPGLFEREADLAAIARAVEHAAAGRGGLLVLEGPAGAGKSSLLAAARERAEEEGFTVLRARAGQLERDFAYGVVRQLLEPVVGRAGLQPEGDQFAVLNGLYWQVADLAETAPLLVAIDDLHWCDAPSLRFVAFLARRVEGLPVLLAAAARRGEPGADEAILADLRADPLATVLEPAPLSVEGVAALLDEADAAPEFRAALHRSSAGNPLLVRELLHAVAAQRIAPDAAGADRLPDLGPEPIARFVSQRLRGLGAPAEALARALAVLGEDADLDLAAAVAALDLREAAGAADALARMDVLESGGGLRFAHPVVREAVYGGMTQPDRDAAHGEAVALLGARGASAQRIASHLLRAPGTGGDGALATLREAAERSEAEGAPDAAVAYLRRALAEPMDGDERAALLLELGVAERRASVPEAIAHLREAHALGADAAIELASALFIDGRAGDAAALLEQAIASAPDRPARHRLEGELIFQSWYDSDRLPAVRPRLLGLRDEIEDDTTGGAYLLALLASDAVRAGRDAEQASAYARRVVACGFSHETHFPYYTAVSAFIGLDELDQALVVCDDLLAQAQRSGSIFAFSFASSFRSYVHLRRGNLAEAEVDARAGVEAVEASAMPGGYPFPFGYLADVLVERGDADGALRLLELPISRRASYQAMIRFHIRSRARLVRGDARGGLDDSLDVGARAERFGLENPAEVEWRSVAAECLLELGEPERAHALATEELAYARRWGAPRPIGRALRLQGRATDGEAGIALLREAADVLAGSPAPLEHAVALADLGAALRRANRRADAREPLAEALDAATRAGADPLAARAREELLATGARPRRVVRSGVDALTPSELRVARLAAAGRTNREIAQSLFVTQKTVEMHLSAAYRKLDLSARSQLASALG